MPVIRECRGRDELGGLNDRVLPGSHLMQCARDLRVGLAALLGDAARRRIAVRCAFSALIAVGASALRKKYRSRFPFDVPSFDHLRSSMLIFSSSWKN
jgi:hypothetical protein